MTSNVTTEARHLSMIRHWSRTRLAIPFALALLTLAGAASFWLAEPAHAQQGPANPPRLTVSLPPERELAMKIKTPFSLTGVGDLIMRTPTGQLADPRFQNLLKPLREADVAFANMEGPIVDIDAFDAPLSGGAPMGALADIKSMGIDMVGTANNHSFDGGQPGVLETIQHLNEGGIAHAGTGRNLQEARAARFVNTPKGTVGLVSVWSVDPTSNGGGAATYENGMRGGRAGLNPLNLTPVHLVTAAHLEALRKIRDDVYARRSEVFAPVPPVPANEPKDRLELFDVEYKVGPKPGNMSYEMNRRDLQEILRSIRSGKQSSDFMVVTIHCHQGSYAFQTYTYDNDVPDFLVEFAHQAIDNGADMFIGHGVHTIRGVEIYKGKPIFYGTNSFIYQYTSSQPQNPGGDLTEAEREHQPGQIIFERLSQPERMESLMVESRFDNGKLVEARIYPADLGQDGTRPLTRVGLPMVPSPEMARRVLEKLQRISKPFGTNIAIENGVGVIRMSAQQSTAAGGR